MARNGICGMYETKADTEARTKEVHSSGVITAIQGINYRTPYAHQKKAIDNLNVIDKLDSYSTLVVLPTGGGKTYTASTWLLKHAINRHKKILWIAHRKMLLDQAAESFQKYAYPEFFPNVSEFRFRIVSGSDSHDRTIDIATTDDLLIASKDSLSRNLDALDAWLKDEDEVYLVIDEAHHSTAKTYRKIIERVQEKVPHTKLIGLTATPMRTAENEQGLLSKIYCDGVIDGKAVKGNKGIAYSIGLKDLIGAQILSKPIIENCHTEEEFGNPMGLDDLKKIYNFDILPKDIAEKLALSAPRNKLIVERYKSKQKQYGQTIVFAIDIDHAIALAKLFNQAGIPAEYIVSNIRDLITGVNTSNEDNERKLKSYRSGKTKVLVNVNILTEGVDLPKTKTVFLTRPTVSTILMTQMVGRALRGKAAGGTDKAYIVSFIDNWNEHIAWVSPENLFFNDDNFTDDPSERFKHELRLIAISKIEEFASLMDDTVDPKIIKVPFKKRIPVGMYAFTYLEENGMDHSYQVMVYDSTRDAYKEMMENLPDLFTSFSSTAEYLPDETLRDMAAQCKDTFFLGEMVPPYDEKDIINILKYYAQHDAAPAFYQFDDVFSDKLDVAAIAKQIYDEDMGPKEKAEYVNSLWESYEPLRLLFGRKIYFWRQLDIELIRLTNKDIINDNVKYDRKQLVDMPLYEIRKYDPAYEKELRDGTFNASLNAKGEYVCAICGRAEKKRVYFQVDHIKPLDKGGKSVPENLQILCRSCNGRKGNKYDD